MYSLGGIGLKSFLLRPGVTGALVSSGPASPTPDEYEFLVDHNGNFLIDHNGNFLITSNAYYQLCDHNSNTLTDQNGNALVAYQKNQNI